MSEFGIAEALKMQQWEVAKGNLRALVAIQGAYHSATDNELKRYRNLDDVVEAFIKNVEREGLAE